MPAACRGASEAEPHTQVLPSVAGELGVEPGSPHSPGDDSILAALDLGGTLGVTFSELWLNGFLSLSVLIDEGDKGALLPEWRGVHEMTGVKRQVQ